MAKVLDTLRGAYSFNIDADVEVVARDCLNTAWSLHAFHGSAEALQRPLVFGDLAQLAVLRVWRTALREAHRRARARLRRLVHTQPRRGGFLG